MGERVSDRVALALSVFCCVGASLVGFCLYRATAPDRTHALGVGQPEGLSPNPMGDSPSEPSGSPVTQQESGHPSGADALSTSPGMPTGATDRKSEAASTDAVPGGVYSQSFSFDLETPQEGLLSTTLDLWNSEAFRKITLAEAREALGRDIAVDLSGDGLLLDRIGGLPTEEDAVHGLDHPEVQDALYRFLVADGICLEFELNPLRNPETDRMLDNAMRARDAAQDALYREMDEHSGYHHWQLLGSVWRARDMK